MKAPKQERTPTNQPVVLDISPPAVGRVACHQHPAAAAELIKPGTDVAGARDQAQALTAAELVAAIKSGIKVGVEEATEAMRASSAEEETESCVL